MTGKLRESVVSFATQLGFDLIGFSTVVPLDIEHSRLIQWLNSGNHAGMSYMERNNEKRYNILEIFPEAKSVISLGMNYYVSVKHHNSPEHGKVSRYAWGKDYHLILWEKLSALIDSLKEQYPAFSAISYVDTGPVMDKAWAVRSGLGWMAKNTNVINPELGSWFFISNIITNLEFDQSEAITDHCGSCTACIDACPTKALVPYEIDARKCISYLTIENKAEIPGKFTGKMDNWLFGCDICQDVCPWNERFSHETQIKEFYPHSGKTTMTFSEVESMTSSEFKKKFAESPILRAKLKGLQRNAVFLKPSKPKD